MSKAFLVAYVAVASCVACQCQSTPVPPALLSEKSPLVASLGFRVDTLRMEPLNQGDDSPGAPKKWSQTHGFAWRMWRRGLEDQKGIYAAPFKPSSIKWDALVLAGTGTLLATDKRIEGRLPDAHFQAYQNTSNIAVGGLAVSLAGLWVYGMRTQNAHLKETGSLELESLANTFLIYAPMQLIAGRQRPGEGNGNGDFLNHHALNTSFPGGHAMFTWSMATVLAREYPKPWVRTLAYGTALTVTASRLLARDHWSSDMFVGSVLGLAIGTHIFHSRCAPGLSQSCHHHARRQDLP